jgi:hypothetical protein
MSDPKLVDLKAVVSAAKSTSAGAKALVDGLVDLFSAQEVALKAAGANTDALAVLVTNTRSYSGDLAGAVATSPMLPGVPGPTTVLAPPSAVPEVPVHAEYTFQTGDTLISDGELANTPPEATTSPLDGTAPMAQPPDSSGPLDHPAPVDTSTLQPANSALPPVTPLPSPANAPAPASPTVNP